MKIKALLTFLVFFVAMSSCYASFPVKRAATTTVTTTANVDVSVNENTTAEYYSPAASNDEKWVAAALWFVLGMFAAHRWYLGWGTGWNILFILTLGGLGIWAIFDIVNILTDNY